METLHPSLVHTRARLRALSLCPSFFPLCSGQGWAGVVVTSSLGKAARRSGPRNPSLAVSAPPQGRGPGGIFRVPGRASSRLRAVPRVGTHRVPGAQEGRGAPYATTEVGTML